MLTNLTVVIILQYMYILNHHSKHRKLTQCYMSLSLKNAEWKNDIAQKMP